jgi:hypothetical protein
VTRAPTKRPNSSPFFHNSPEIVTLALKHGADPNEKNGWNRAPLMPARVRKRGCIADLLVAAASGWQGIEVRKWSPRKCQRDARPRLAS